MLTHELDNEQLKAHLRDYIKQTTDFKDVNFEGSAINQLINILAYTATYQGLYLQMNQNENYLSTAKTKEALIAGAKRNGYIVRGKRCSRAEVYVERIVDEVPAERYIHLSRDIHIQGINSLSSIYRDFVFDKDVFLYDYEKTQDGKYKFTSKKTFTLIQGERREWKTIFRGDPTQRFLIKDRDIDIDTIRMYVKNTIDEKEIGEEYKMSTNMVRDAGKNNKNFFIAGAENGWYEIFFGNDIIAKSPKLNQYIIIEYIAPLGTSGDGCTEFKVGGFTLKTAAPSFGGSDGESNEMIRYNAIHSYRRQNRLLTEGDIKSILLEEFRNIKSINVWGGEENIPKKYGKVIISVKPNNSEALSQGAKIDIRKRLLDTYAYCGMDIELIDPEYVNIDMRLTAVLSDEISHVSRTDIEGKIKEIVDKYSSEHLNQFGNYYNDIDLNSMIVNEVNGVDSVYSEKMLSKQMEVNTKYTSMYLTTLNNKIEKGTVKSQFKDYNYTWNVWDEEGKLFALTKNQYNEEIKKEIGNVDYEHGTFQFYLPLISGIDFSYIIDLKAKAAKPNIYSKHVNIVRIRTVEIADVLRETE